MVEGALQLFYGVLGCMAVFGGAYLLMVLGACIYGFLDEMRH